MRVDAPSFWDDDWKYRRCNFHRADLVEQAVNRLSLAGEAPRVVVLSGEPGIGRRYFAETVVHELAQRGEAPTLVLLDPAAWEPDKSIAATVESLAAQRAARRGPGAASNVSAALAALRNAVNVDVAVTDPSGFAALAIAVQLGAQGLFGALGKILSHVHTPGEAPATPPREEDALYRFLALMCEERRLVLCLREPPHALPRLDFALANAAHVLPGLSLIILAEPEDPLLGVASRPDVLRLHLKCLDPDETERELTTRFTPNAFPNAFLRAFSRVTQGNPVYVAYRLAALLEQGVVRQDESEVWQVGTGGAGAEAYGAEFAPDYDAILIQALATLPDEHRTTGKRFLELAAVCGDEFPDEVLALAAGCDADGAGVFLDAVDEHLVSGPDAVLDEVGVDEPNSAGFLAYRFAHPLFRWIVRSRWLSRARLKAAAAELFAVLGRETDPSTPPVARIWLRVADATGDADLAMSTLLRLTWCAERDQSQDLAALWAEALRGGHLAENVAWRLTHTTQRRWPPHRRVALFDALWASGSVTPDALEPYRLGRGWALLADTRWREAGDEARALLDAVETGTLWHGLGLSLLGACKNALGEFEASREFLDAGVTVLRRVAGPEHPDTLATLHSLAGVQEAQGRYEEAEAGFRAVLEVQRRKLGPEHPSTLATLHNLASVQKSQGRYEEAEAGFRAVLEVERSKLGPEHPSTLTTLHSLAGVQEAQGRYEEAEAGFRAVLEVQRRKLGPEHPSTLATLHNLASVQKSQGRYEEAEAGYRAVLEVNRSKLGPEHPDTLATLHNLAIVQESQGRYEEAEAGFRAVLEVHRSKLGPEHPDTVRTDEALRRVRGNREP